MYRIVGRAVFDSEDCGESGHLHIGWREMQQTVESDRWHYMYEETVEVSIGERGKQNTGVAYLVTLSREWKTKEFLHIAIATALLPLARQYVAMNSRFEFGATHIVSRSIKLTK